LLIRNGWAEQKALDAFLDNPNIIKELFMYDPDVSKPTYDAEWLCGCCFCPAEPHEVIRMDDCGHMLCNECFEQYLLSKLSDGPEVVFTICPDEKCNNIVPEKIFKQLLPEDKYKRYMEFLFKSYVEINKHAKWCPGNDCKRVCEYTGAD